MDNILDLLECCVCTELMFGGIYICTVGHSLCSKCSRHLRYCPMCNSSMKSTHNISMEKLLKAFMANPLLFTAKKPTPAAAPKTKEAAPKTRKRRGRKGIKQ
ncbi:hypothetical protein BDFB_012162 [Asbolus verrucosus]|uniref:RING-type domain-containing protein n=1 Tax=Asbolus verrucosus TaxID=1661398 RepID=A0A482WCU0_ASBVE|nr:hypothetical protein BDFB_012162 [Asbolus verrucosus]